jgi:hypothetical protein
MKTNNKKLVAGMELLIIVVSTFAFSYFIYASEGSIEKFEKDYSEYKKERASLLVNAALRFLNYSKKPMLPMASAADNDSDGKWPYSEEEMDQIKQYGALLTEEETRTTFTISADSGDTGCCGLTKSGFRCATTAPSECQEYFAQGSLCASTSFCQKGCCYDDNLGIYDQNVLKINCPKEWITDPNCNIPAAHKGCCVLGTITIFETEKQCEIDTLSRALGPNSTVDWRGDVNEANCIMLATTQKEGACVLEGGDCKFITEAECLNYNGEFNEGYLCTASSLGTDCEMTEQTTCIKGKDEVYFVDSCGNPANIYDSTKAKLQSYWEQVVSAGDSCRGELDKGNANSKTCGNCNRILGGICSSALSDNFEPTLGEYYCKDTSCTYKGTTYKNGESWCVYDGAIGNGDDIVGSRHWKYVCSYGEIQIEPCADYRNQICIQQDTFDYNGTNVTFRSASCIANNWRECIDLNSEGENGTKKCEDTLNCRIEHVDIADKFKFDICTPKYPGGFAIKDARYQESAKKICGMATQTCTVIYKQKFMGGCECATNCACEEAGFAQGMNDLCRKLGDCGLEVNVAGKYTENYRVEKSPKLSSDWIAKLVAMSNPVPGQHAELENYTEYLEAAGIFGKAPDRPEDAEEPTDYSSFIMMGGIGIAGIAYAGYMLGYFTVTTAATGLYAVAPSLAASLSSMGLSVGTPAATAMAPFAGAAIGAGIGMIAGMYLAKALGLSPFGTLLMAVGGGIIGGTVGYFLLTQVWCIPCLIIGAILMLIALFFMGADCDPVEVKFECKPWQPPTGGADCEKCDDDPLKPCSEYRCESLGAACSLVNKGTDEELCLEDNPNDVAPPKLDPYLGVISPGEIYEDVTGDGFSITKTDGSCVDAYTPLVFGIVTDEPAKCRFDVSQKEFSEMSFDLGGNVYIYNHTTSFVLPDPSHGQSQGAQWNGDLTFYIKCEDTHGHISPNYYTVDMCVNQGPDKTPPMVRATNPANDLIVGYGKTSQDLAVVTNELATCKWDKSDKSYDQMTNSMVCTDTLAHPTNPQGYVCNTTVPINGTESSFYIRCMDQPWLNETSDRNANSESFVFTVNKPSTAIKIDSVEPSGEFETPTEFTSISLEVQTSGGGEYHKCAYSFSGYENMIEMFETGAERHHVQPLNLAARRHKIYVQCVDETGEYSRSQAEFRIIRDTSTPQIARLWQEGGTMHFITTEMAECKLSTDNCKFKWADAIDAGNGESHSFTVVKGNTYYIKCKDEFGNVPSGCSMEARAL